MIRARLTHRRNSVRLEGYKVSKAPSMSALKQADRSGKSAVECLVLLKRHKQEAVVDNKVSQAMKGHKPGSGKM